MPDDVDTDSIDDKIEYHREMEHLAYQAKDLALAAHHRWMQDMLEDMKKKRNKVPEKA